MNDELTVVLREVAGLLRQVTTQMAEGSKRAQERFAKIPDADSFARFARDIAAMDAEHDGENKLRREKAERQRAEDLAFREKLLDAIERHNQLLGRLLERTASPSDADRERHDRT